jgi:hypothetical protein
VDYTGKSRCYFEDELRNRAASLAEFTPPRPYIDNCILSFSSGREHEGIAQAAGMKLLKIFHKREIDKNTG